MRQNESLRKQIFQSMLSILVRVFAIDVDRPSSSLCVVIRSGLFALEEVRIQAPSVDAEPRC